MIRWLNPAIRSVIQSQIEDVAESATLERQTLLEAMSNGIAANLMGSLQVFDVDEFVHWLLLGLEQRRQAAVPREDMAPVFGPTSPEQPPAFAPSGFPTQPSVPPPPSGVRELVREIVREELAGMGSSPALPPPAFAAPAPQNGAVLVDPNRMDPFRRALFQQFMNASR